MMLEGFHVYSIVKRNKRTTFAIMVKQKEEVAGCCCLFSSKFS
jgi:hypothetical protein